MKVLLPILVSAALLAALAGEAFTRPSPGDTEPYHRQVKSVVEGLPMSLTGHDYAQWVGRDEKVLPEATALLKPNVILSRTYINHRTGAGINLLVVQCRDARDMLGHYPPVCYAGQGWVKAEATPTDWKLGERVIPGIQYRFSRVMMERSAQEAEQDTVVANFLMRPDGVIVRDMDGINRAAKSFKTRYYGAAQVQIAMSGAIPAEQRTPIIQTFIKALGEVIETISPDPAGHEGATPGGNRE